MSVSMKEFSGIDPLGKIVFSSTGVVSTFLFSVVRVNCCIMTSFTFIYILFLAPRSMSNPDIMVHNKYTITICCHSITNSTSVMLNSIEVYYL